MRWHPATDLRAVYGRRVPEGGVGQEAAALAARRAERPSLGHIARATHEYRQGNAAPLRDLLSLLPQ